MIINLIVLALLIGLLLAVNIASLLPVFVVRFLVRAGLYRQGSLGYEKYEYTDTSNRTSIRSRYFYRSTDNFKSTCTGKINLILILICVLACEITALSLYMIVQ